MSPATNLGMKHLSKNGAMPHFRQIPNYRQRNMVQDPVGEPSNLKTILVASVSSLRNSPESIRILRLIRIIKHCSCRIH